jgi:hypothetical protein
MDMFLLPMKLRCARNGDAEDERGNKPRRLRLLEGWIQKSDENEFSK